MTREEAEARAEKIVYGYYSYGDIVRRCIQADIKIIDHKGKLLPRSELEDKLIEYCIKRYTTEREGV